MTFDEFIAARLGALVRYATVVTWDPHLAEDIIQDVLIRAQARWSRISRLDAPEQYVKRMVLNEFLSWRRRRAARLIPVSTELIDGRAAPVADHAGRWEERDAALRAIATLPPMQRAVIALRYYEDMSDVEISGLLGCRPGTVRSHVSRALATLRTTLPESLTTPRERA